MPKAKRLEDVRHERILSKTTVADRLGVHIATVDRMVKAGTFPQPLKVSAQRIGWRAATFDRWIRERDREANADATVEAGG